MRNATCAGSLHVILALLMSTRIAADEKHDYPLKPMSFEKVTLQDSFWLPRLKLQAKSTVPHALVQTEPAVENLRRCGNFLHGRGGELPFPHRFVSSDLYKVMEGAAYLLMIEPDPTLEKQLDEIIGIIAEIESISYSHIDKKTKCCTR